MNDNKHNFIMDYTNKTTKSEIEEKIINLLNNKFSQKGYHKFTMDELASELHVSKKTIYRSFPTKEELLRKMLIDKLSFAYTVIVSNIQAQTNVVEKFIEFSKIIQEYFVLFNDESLYRLKHYYPKLADEIINLKKERVIPLIKLLLRVGRKKKIILDIPDNIIIKVFTAALSSISQMKKSYNEIEYQKTFESAFELLLNGILTKKGKQLLINKRINNESN
ncbi:TetR/AcrR family transcriptional regulator [Melioribacteraceae bacterium 4301-Me]|uniref:TetR/AcrR family transcriptional regulator n=1 Tax=Pyranulibacter aquaticus TaxID=3163344 RepID=UPI0035993A10